MTTATDAPAMTGQEIVDLTRKHTLFEWSAQSKVDPIPVARAKGIYFWTPEGKRFIDFNSQLMSVNIGHGDERVIQAIHEDGLRSPAFQAWCGCWIPITASSAGGNPPRRLWP